VLRRQLVGSLLAVVGTNLRQGREDVAIFEIGKGYARDGAAADATTREWWRLAFALSGEAAPPSWNRPARIVDLDDAKGIVELACRHLGFAAPSYSPDRRGYPFHPGRTAIVEARALPDDRDAGRVVLHGRVAELHPDALDAFELRAGRVIVGELAVRGLAGGDVGAVRAAAVPRFPSVDRDIAVVVSEATPVADVLAVIDQNGAPLLRERRLFDIYRGAPLAADQKSLAFRLVLQAADRTLTEPELEAAVDAIADALRLRLGAQRRV
jgi:phenylalanyl-tRNA synthetase beta chain